MARSIAIKNFRSIEAVSLELPSFSVVVGKNGSGKSNFADAFVFTRDLVDDPERAVSSRGGIRSVRRWSSGRPFEVSMTQTIESDSQKLEHSFVLKSLRDAAWEFKAETLSARIRGYSINMERLDSCRATRRLRLHAELSNSPVVSDFELGPRQSIYREGLLHGPTPRLGIGLRSVNRYRLNPDEMRKPQNPSDSERLTENGQNIGSALMKMSQADKKDVVEKLSSIIDGLTDVVAYEAGRYVAVNFKQQAEFDASEISDGAMRALGIIVAAKQIRRNDLLIVEEPEANIHPGAARHIYEILKEASSKGSVLITTHSPEILDSAVDDNILVSKLVDGLTKIGPVEENQKNLIRENLFSLAELMRTEPLRIEGEVSAN
jgi:type I restriction enzyme M protein